MANSEDITQRMQALPQRPPHTCPVVDNAQGECRRVRKGIRQLQTEDAAAEGLLSDADSALDTAIDALEEVRGAAGALRDYGDEAWEILVDASVAMAEAEARILELEAESATRKIIIDTLSKQMRGLSAMPWWQRAVARAYGLAWRARFAVLQSSNDRLRQDVRILIDQLLEERGKVEE